VIALLSVKTLDFTALLAEETGAGLLTQCACINQAQHCWGQAKVCCEAVIRQLILHGADHVCQRVQTNHVSSTVSTRFGAPQTSARQFINLLVSQGETTSLLKHGQNAKNTDAVTDEIGGIFGTNHAFAQLRYQESFQNIQQLGLGVLRGDQLHQAHVAWWVEKVHAAKTWAQRFRQNVCQGSDGQARRVAGDDGVRVQCWPDLAVQVLFPVQTLGNGFDHQIAIGQTVQIVVVVGGLDQVCQVWRTQGSRIHFAQIGNGTDSDAIFWPLAGGQIKQNYWYACVHAMGGNLRAHDAGTAHGDPTQGTGTARHCTG